MVYIHVQCTGTCTSSTYTYEGTTRHFPFFSTSVFIFSTYFLRCTVVYFFVFVVLQIYMYIEIENRLYINKKDTSTCTSCVENIKKQKYVLGLLMKMCSVCSTHNYSVFSPLYLRQKPFYPDGNMPLLLFSSLLKCIRTCTYPKCASIIEVYKIDISRSKINPDLKLHI